MDERIGAFDSEFVMLARSDETTRRLATVPGIGPINATALVAAVGGASAFAKGRDMAAWRGLVPRQAKTGGRPRLLGISKRGNRYLRKNLVHGARRTRIGTTRIIAPTRAGTAHLTSPDSRAAAWPSPELREPPWLRPRCRTATHNPPKVLAWLLCHFTPTACSWINAVETFFAALTKRRLRRGVFRSIVDLQTAIATLPSTMEAEALRLDR